MRCGIELEEVPEVCPDCGFHPRDKGLKMTMYAMIGVMLLFLAATLLMHQWPVIAGGLLQLAGLGFLIAVILLVLAFASNPYRLGWLFR